MNPSESARDMFSRFALINFLIIYSIYGVGGVIGMALLAFLFGTAILWGIFLVLIPIAMWWACGKAANQLHGELMGIYRLYVGNIHDEARKWVDQRSDDLLTNEAWSEILEQARAQTLNDIESRQYKAIDADWQSQNL